MSDPLSLSTAAQDQLVPAGYAQKAMASIMQLHTELMDEKERRVELYRTLMQREQSLAELRAYVKELEAKVREGAPAVSPEPPRRVATMTAVVAPPSPRPAEPAAQAPAAAPRQPTVANARPPVPPAIRPHSRNDGWKTW